MFLYILVYAKLTTFLCALYTLYNLYFTKYYYHTTIILYHLNTYINKTKYNTKNINTINDRAY